MGDIYIANHSFSRKLAIKNCWGKGSLKRQHHHLPKRQPREAALQSWAQTGSPEGRRSQPLVATDDISCDGRKIGREMGATPDLELPSLLSLCEGKMLFKSSDAQGK